MEAEVRLGNQVFGAQLLAGRSIARTISIAAGTPFGMDAAGAQSVPIGDLPTIDEIVPTGLQLTLLLSVETSSVSDTSYFNEDF